MASYLIGLYSHQLGVNSIALDAKRFYAENHCDHGEQQHYKVTAHVVRWRYVPINSTLYWINPTQDEIADDIKASVRRHINSKGLHIATEQSFYQFTLHVQSLENE
ncbi:MAG: hypothetical protein ACOYM3_29160 [Terrimicrobiaceae bacterium]